MKKTKLLSVMSALFVMTACGGEKQIVYKEKWDYDDTHHWHEAVNGNGERSNYEEHTYGSKPQEFSDGEYWVCSKCFQKKKYEGGSTHPIDTDDGLFSEVTEFENTVEIHTPAQKEYLAYTGEYLTMDRNSYPDGNKKNSNPIQVANQDVDAVKTTVTWNYEDHSEDTTYSVSISSKSDFSDGFDIAGTNEQSIDLYNLYLGKNYYKINAIVDGSIESSSGVHELTVDSTYPRNLYVGNNMTNCRDMGGRVIENGNATIKQGLIYRTCGNGYNQDGVKIDQEGIDIMLKQLKVKTEIVLHNDSGFNFNLDGTKVFNTYMDYKNGTNTKHHFSRNTENVKNVFEILANENNYPVYYHCRIGTDRTGLIAILVNGVLGVSLNDIYQDYLFSNFGKIGSKRKIGAGDEDDITNYMNEILSMKGDTFQEKVYNVLITIGVPATTIAKVQNLLLDGTAPSCDNGQVVVSADKMTLAGGLTLQTENKAGLESRNNPAAYTTLSAGGTATFSFNGEGVKELWMYVGNSDQSTSKKFNASMSVTVDGADVSVSTMTFKDAGMGNYRNRVNYYFVKIGNTASLSAGSHTVVVTGIANSLNLGNVSVL